MDNHDKCGSDSSSFRKSCREQEQRRSSSSSTNLILRGMEKDGCTIINPRTSPMTNTSTLPRSGLRGSKLSKASNTTTTISSPSTECVSRGSICQGGSQKECCNTQPSVAEMESTLRSSESVTKDFRWGDASDGSFSSVSTGTLPVFSTRHQRQSSQQDGLRATSPPSRKGAFRVEPTRLEGDRAPSSSSDILVGDTRDDEFVLEAQVVDEEAQHEEIQQAIQQAVRNALRNSSIAIAAVHHAEQDEQAPEERNQSLSTNPKKNCYIKNPFRRKPALLVFGLLVFLISVAFAVVACVRHVDKGSAPIAEDPSLFDVVSSNSPTMIPESAPSTALTTQAPTATPVLVPVPECFPGDNCQNPYHMGGCLYQKLYDIDSEKALSYIRACHSEDDLNAASQGKCRPPKESATEIRIASQNWENAIAQAWILQIILSELMGVPATIETGDKGQWLEFYNIDYAMGDGGAFHFDALRRGNEIGDCSLVRDTDDEYKACANVMAEVWDDRIVQAEPLELEDIIAPRQHCGYYGQEGLYIPKFTAEHDPTLLSYIGLSGEEHRRKLAEMFLPPVSWGDYCDFVSPDGCSTPDTVAQRAPRTSYEKERMFVQDVYTGYFQATEENDCDLHPTTCVGHVIDYPCSWISSLPQNFFHLNIAMKSKLTNGGYDYSQMMEIWKAANATKSHVMMKYWGPEPVSLSFLHTEQEFQRVELPVPTIECLENRVTNHEIQCDPSATDHERFGSPLGVCDDPPQNVYRLVTESVRQQQPDVFDVIRRFSITTRDMEQILQDWTKMGSRAAVCTWVTDNVEKLETLVAV